MGLTGLWFEGQKYFAFYLDVGRNEISILVPCHRVVGTNGSLTGYAGGIEKKIALLKLEGALKREYFVPKHSAAP